MGLFVHRLTLSEDNRVLALMALGGGHGTNPAVAVLVIVKSKIWWCRFTAPDGQRIRRSTGTAERLAAREYEDRLKAQLWRTQKLGEKPRRTWEEAVVRWLRETGHKKDRRKDLAKFRWFDAHLRGKYMDEIDRGLIESMAVTKERAGCRPATVNRYLALIGAILRKAWQDWEWIERVPRVRMRQEPKRRIRFLTRAEAERLLAELPPHLAEMARFAFATGLRMGNIVGLRWSQVDLERRAAWVHPEEAKAGKAIGIPLNAEAMRVLRRQQGQHPEQAFTYRGRPVKRCSTQAWYKALKRAGIKDFRWHDLRHTWASWHVQAGTPLHVLQEMGGWESAEMVRRYGHLGVHHLAEYAEKLSQPRLVDPEGTNLAQGKVKKGSKSA